MGGAMGAPPSDSEDEPLGRGVPSDSEDEPIGGPIGSPIRSPIRSRGVASEPPPPLSDSEDEPIGGGPIGYVEPNDAKSRGKEEGATLLSEPCLLPPSDSESDSEGEAAVPQQGAAAGGGSPPAEAVSESDDDEMSRRRRAKGGSNGASKGGSKGESSKPSKRSVNEEDELLEEVWLSPHLRHMSHPIFAICHSPFSPYVTAHVLPCFTGCICLKRGKSLTRHFRKMPRRRVSLSYPTGICLCFAGDGRT